MFTILSSIQQALVDNLAAPVMSNAIRLGETFSKVERVQVDPKPVEGIRLQRAWVATRKPGLSEYASIVREQEMGGGMRL